MCDAMQSGESSLMLQGDILPGCSCLNSKPAVETETVQIVYVRLIVFSWIAF